jgi:tetrahydromethanopterin S-methyltransferase subunit C
MNTNNGPGLMDTLRSTREEASHVRGEMGDIAGELQRLAQLEMALAKAEADEARGHATRGATFGFLSFETAMIGFIFLFLATMFALDTAMPLWAAALITSGIAMLLAAILGLVARSEMKQFSPVPKRFMRTVQEDIKWARTQMKLSGR